MPDFTVKENTVNRKQILNMISSIVRLFCHSLKNFADGMDKMGILATRPYRLLYRQIDPLALDR
jgi:hypothetical protein